MNIFDLNAGCGHWPLYPTPPADPKSLESLLKKAGISRACAYPMEAYFYPDPQDANEKWLPALAESAFFVPSAVLNPAFPGFLKAYAQCRERWRVPMVRLLPGFHLYQLDRPEVDELASAAGADGVVLGIHVRAEDVRTYNPLVQPPVVPVADIASLARRHPMLKVVVFCALYGEITQLETIPDNLFFEFSFAESPEPMGMDREKLPVDRRLFGSHAPLFYPEANIRKIAMAPVTNEVKAAVFGDNARRLLGDLG